jgi:site-specific DNA recombinase
MEQSRRVSPRRRGENIYILTGKLFCGECGAAMTGNSQLSGKSKIHYDLYTCGNKKQRKNCDNPNVRKEAIEKLVLDKLEGIFANAEAMIDSLVEKSKVQNKEAEEEFKVIQKEVNEINTKMDRLFTAIENGTMDAAVAGPRLNLLTREKDMLEIRLRELSDRKQLPTLSRGQIESYVKRNQQILTERTDLLACKQVVDDYIIKVILGKEDFEVKAKFHVYADKMVVPTRFLSLSAYGTRKELFKQR